MGSGAHARVAFIASSIAYYIDGLLLVTGHRWLTKGKLEKKTPPLMTIRLVWPMPSLRQTKEENKLGNVKRQSRPI